MADRPMDPRIPRAPSFPKRPPANQIPPNPSGVRMPKGPAQVQRNAPAPPIYNGPQHPAMRPIAKIGGMAATGGPAIQPGVPAPTAVNRLPRTSSR